MPQKCAGICALFFRAKFAKNAGHFAQPGVSTFGFLRLTRETGNRLRLRWVNPGNCPRQKAHQLKVYLALQLVFSQNAFQLKMQLALQPSSLHGSMVMCMVKWFFRLVQNVWSMDLHRTFWIGFKFSDATQCVRCVVAFTVAPATQAQTFMNLSGVEFQMKAPLYHIDENLNTFSVSTVAVYGHDDRILPFLLYHTGESH